MNKRTFNKIIKKLGDTACEYGGYGYWKPVNGGVSRMVNHDIKIYKTYDARLKSLKQFHHDYSKDGWIEENTPF